MKDCCSITQALLSSFALFCYILVFLFAVYLLCINREEGRHRMSMETSRLFEIFKLSLPPEKAVLLQNYVTAYDHHVLLPKKEKELMHRDFENAILKYDSLGVSFEAMLERLAIRNLGDFYSRSSLRWFPLDNAAKIYPFSMAHGRMAVFRLSVYLKEEVIPEILQMALTFTIKRFPSFSTTIKKGFFWHYLDTSKRRYSLETETSIPCRPLKVARSGSQSFRVIYYQNRISIEYFHIITDGFGGMVFLKTLLAEYLHLLGIESKKDSGTFDINKDPSPQELTNEFNRVPKTRKGSGFVDRPVMQMSGKLSRQRPCRVLHFLMNADSLKQAARKHHATITSYLLALIFIAGKQATDEAEGVMGVQVPVNMRKHYPSKSLRNFSMYCGIRLPFENISDIQTIIKKISGQLVEKTSRSAMSEMVTATGRIVEALRYIPLFAKTPVVKLVTNILSDKIFSNTLSNLGIVSLLPEVAQHVQHMEMVLGPAISNRASCALVTFGNTAALSITKITADPTFEEKLYSLLLSDAVSLTVEGSELYAN
jgi:NRPS condensation-like uncharacterized protein